MQARFVEYIFNPNGKLFYLKKSIIAPGSAPTYRFSNIIFKIEDNKVFCAYEVTSQTSIGQGYLITYKNGIAEETLPKFTVTKDRITFLIDWYCETFINEYYAKYGKTVILEKSDMIGWYILGKIESIIKIDNETNYSIRLRSATYNK